MAKYEILRVDLAVDGAQEQEWILEEMLEQLRKQMNATAQSLSKAFGAINKNAGQGLQSFYKLYKQVVTGQETKLAATSLKRTVSGFDELNRLAKKNVGGSVSQQNQQLMNSAFDLVEKVGQLGGIVKEKVITPLSQWSTGEMSDRMDRLKEKLGGVFAEVQQNLFGVNAYNEAWGRLNLTTGFWKDLVDETAVSTGLFNEVMQNSGLAAGQTKFEMEKLNLQIADGSGKWVGLQSAAQSTWNHISSLWGGTGTWFSQSVTGPVDSSFNGMLTNMELNARDSWGNTKGVFGDAGGFFSGVFSEAWGKVVDVFSKDGEVFVDVEGGVLSGFKGVVNELIDGINQVSVTPFGGLNKALDKLQNIKIGNLQPFSFLDWRASVPKIPHLARGAVLPANKPFLAMLGDQRHGTNIEAPLSTIQEAVAATMEEFSAGNMAGHQATVELLGSILEAVMGIQIGDDTIAAACDRHNRKMSIVTGR